MIDIKAAAAKYENYIKETRKKFHRYPEASMHEYKTSAMIEEELKALGIEYRRCGAETGWLATVGGKNPGKTVLLRADMDGLSVKEQTGLPWASEHEGFMHACGHDTHIATLLTVAHILKDIEDEIPGTVKLAFQPGEEIAHGAKAMVADGVLEGVDACFSMHTWGGVETGLFACTPGEAMCNCGYFTIDVEGKTSHGSAPDAGIDAVVVTAAIVNNLQTVVSRELSPLAPAVLTVGSIQAGSRFNVLAGSSHMEGTTRTFSPEIANRFAGMITRVCEDTAAAFRAKATVNYTNITEPVVNDVALAHLAQKAGAKIVGQDKVVDLGRITGAEDFCYFMAPNSNVPGVQTFIGSGCMLPNHHEKFYANEEALLPAAEIYCQFAMDFLSQQ